MTEIETYTELLEEIKDASPYTSHFCPAATLTELDRHDSAVDLARGVYEMLDCARKEHIVSQTELNLIIQYLGTLVK